MAKDANVLEKAQQGMGKVKQAAVDAKQKTVEGINKITQDIKDFDINQNTEQETGGGKLIPKLAVL